MEFWPTLIIVTLIIFIGLIFHVQSKRYKLSPADQQRLRSHWKRIQMEVKSNPKSAVLEADKLLDEALRLKGFRGSLGQKLKKAQPLFRNANAVWGAHKLRNRLAHELDHPLTEREAKRALNDFKVALVDLGVPLL